jgi:hypothetical protein
MDLDSSRFPEIIRNIPENTFVAVCGRDEALWSAPSASGEVFLCLRTCTPEECRKIRAEAAGWVILEEYSEWYDYDAYANLGGEYNRSVTGRTLADRAILTEDGAFAGAVLYFPELFHPISCAFAADWRGKPLKICTVTEEKPADDIEAPTVFHTFCLEKKT